eukprot:ANDGO_03547.mRNA.1 Putative elongation of fatty acids protein DDB_G0272012
MDIVSVLRDADAFVWSPGSTPLASVQTVPIAIAVYLFTVFALQLVMKTCSVRPFQLQWFSGLHNMILCVWSAIMMVGTLFEMYNLYVADENGIRSSGYSSRMERLFCRSFSEPPRQTARLQYWAYVYYLSKFYELIDTVIMVLKKKKLIFLHVYHHAIVIAMVYSWLDAHMVFHAYGLLFNVGIHVVMYYYYARCSLGRRVIRRSEIAWVSETHIALLHDGSSSASPRPRTFANSSGRTDLLEYELQMFQPFWKRYLTSMQLVQFATSFFLTFIYAYYYQLRNGDCTGLLALIFTLSCNASFLYLFTDFFKKTYTTSKKLPSVKKE